MFESYGQYGRPCPGQFDDRDAELDERDEQNQQDTDSEEEQS